MFTSCNLALKTSDKGFYWQKQRVNVDEEKAIKSSNQIETITYNQPSSLPQVSNQPGMARLLDSSQYESFSQGGLLTSERISDGQQAKKPILKKMLYKEPLRPHLKSKRKYHTSQASANPVSGFVKVFFDLYKIMFIIFGIIMLGMSGYFVYETGGLTDFNTVAIASSLFFFIVAALL